jgi:hypothetical protein
MDELNNEFLISYGTSLHLGSSFLISFSCINHSYEIQLERRSRCHSLKEELRRVSDELLHQEDVSYLHSIFCVGGPRRKN